MIDQKLARLRTHRNNISRYRRLLKTPLTDFERGSTKIAMVAFDLLYLNGYDLRKLPLIERKALLKKLIAKTAIQFSSKSTGRRYLSMLVRSASKASSQKFATAAIFPPGAMTG